MDVLSGVRSFVAVARRGSFSAGADDERTTQPVVSRRIAALEESLGGALIERNTRPVGLTPLGRAIIGNAQTLLAAERALLDAASSHLRGEIRLLVPRNHAPTLWAAVRLRASATGLEINVVEEEREGRVLGFHTGAANAAILPVESARAEWLVPLGLAQVTEQRRLTLAALRPTRADGGRAARVVVMPEDATPSLLAKLRDVTARFGLGANQVHTAVGLVPALSGALAGDDWILSTPAEAEAWGLAWVAVPDLQLSRTYRLATRTPEDGALFDPQLRHDIATALSARAPEGN